MNHTYEDNLTQLYCGDALDVLRMLEPENIQCVVTSPPYWGLRVYDGVTPRDWDGYDGEAWHGLFGLEPLHDCLGWAEKTRCNTCYVCHMMLFLDGIWRVLRDDGTVWINLGDSYTSKELAGVPWRIAFAAQANGWYLRSDIIWSKTNPMPENVTDRPTKSHEYIFLLTKNKKYYYDADAIKETSMNAGKIISLGEKSFAKRQALGLNIPPSGNGLSESYLVPDYRNKRSVWEVATQPYPDAHLATFPEKLVEPCILAGTTTKSVVLDPFSGSGTTGVVARRLNRKSTLIESSQEYCDIIVKRITETQPALL